MTCDISKLVNMPDFFEADAGWRVFAKENPSQNPIEQPPK